MKNNIYKIVSFVLILSATGSCVDLDTVPLNSVTSLTYWKQPTAAIETVNSCYQWIGSALEILYNDGATDNAYVRSSSGQNQALGNGRYSTADPYVKSYWSNRYSGIKMCNTVTDNIQLVPGLTDALRNRLLSEVRVLRALHYFELTSRFGAVPYFTNVISIAEAAKISRTDHQTVIANILKELDDVITNHYLPNTYATVDYGRITHWAAMGLKARILLSEGRYAEVKTVSQDIITNGGYQLHPVYEQLFQPGFEKNKEIMLDVQYVLSSRENAGNYQFLPPSLQGIANIVPVQELVDSYIMINGKGINETGSGYDPNNPWINRDPRFQMTICVNNGTYTKSDGKKVTIVTDPKSTTSIDRFQPGTAVITTSSGYYFKKFYDNTATTAQKSGLNYPIIRFAEVLLMYAEACAETNTLTSTEWNNTIKKLRVRAGFTDPGATEFPSDKTQAELIDIVRNERRVELVMEGLRLQDIFRWKIADKVLNGNIHGEYTGAATGTDNGFYIIENRKFDSTKHYLWPVPQSEKDIDPNLGQNPNWQ